MAGAPLTDHDNYPPLTGWTRFELVADGNFSSDVFDKVEIGGDAQRKVPIGYSHLD